MSDGSEVVYSYVADSSGIMDAIDEVSAGIQSLIEDINALVEASSALGEFEGIFEEIASIFSGVDAAAGEATAGIAGMAEEAGVAADALAAVGADSEALAAVSVSADEAASAIGAIVEEASVAADALTAVASVGDELTVVGAAASDAASQVGSIGVSALQMSNMVVSAIDVAQAKLVLLQSKAQDAADTLAEMQAEAATSGDFSGIDEATAQLVLLQSKAQDAAAALAELTVAASEESVAMASVAESETVAEGETASLAAMMGDFGDTLQAAQGPLMMISMAAIGAGAAMFNMGSKAEDALNQVQALAGVGSAQMSQYTSQLEEQATQFGESLDQEAQGLFYVTSAGFSGAGAMKVLAQSVMDAKAGNIDLATSANGLTTVLNAYGVSADQASKYNDIMVTAVTNGKQTFQDFATSIAKAAVEGNAAHISFNQVAAAEAALTDQGLSARNASNALTSMMRAMDANIDKTAETATKLGLSFNETAFKSMDLFHQMQYLQDITKGNQTELSKLVGGATGVAAFNALMTKSSDGTYKFATILDTMKNSTGAAAQAFATSQETISAHWAKVQASLSVISYKALEALAPAINMVADAVGKAADFMSQHMDIVMPILAGLAAFFGVIIVSAIGAFLAAMAPVVAPFIAVAAVIGAVVAGITLLIQHWDQLTQALGPVKDAMNSIQDKISGVMNAIGVVTEQGTLKAKLSAINNTIDQKNKLIASYQEQKTQIEQEMSQTDSSVERHSLQMKLTSINNAEEQAKGTIAAAQKQRTGIEAQLNQLDPSVKLHALQQKETSINHSLEQAEGTVANYAKQKAGIEKEIAASHDIATRNALAMKLEAIDAAQKQAQGVVNAMAKQKSGVETQMKQQKAIVERDSNANLLLKTWNGIQGAWNSIMKGIGDAMKAVEPIFKAIGGAFDDVGKTVKSSFAPAWDDAKKSFMSILPLFKQIWDALVPLKPLFELIAGIVGGVVLFVLASLAGVITGLAKGLAAFIGGISKIIAGFVQTFTGLFQIVSGVVRVIIDIFTGNFKGLGPALGQIWQGILNVLGGVWKGMVGAFQAVFGTIWGLVSGFVTGVWNFFVDLYDRLIGHSIIPDMINGMLNWFEQLPGKAIAFINTLVTNMTTTLGGLGAKALTWAGDMISQFVQGIENGIGAVGSAVSKIANKIAGFLHFSKPDVGPLADADIWMPDFMNLLSKGIDDNIDKVKNSALNIATQISAAAPNPSNLPQGPSAANNANSAQIAQILQQFFQQQQSRQQVPQPTSANLGAVTQHFSGGINFSGVPQDINALFQMLNQLSGLQFEYGQRGATFNY